MLTTFLQHTVFGIVTGSILLLGSIGFSMTFTVKRFLNIGHAELLTTSAYVAYACNVILGWNLFYSGVVAVVATTLLGLAIAQWLYKPMEHHTPLITPIELMVVGIALISVILLHLLLTRTKVGKAFRAMSTQSTLPMTKGIDTDRISVFVWIFSSAMAAIAGILLAMVTSVNPDLGWAQLLIILAATVMGGLGSVYGVMIGAILIGLAMDLGVIFLPAGYRPAIAFVLIIVMLIFKPKGIFGGE